MNSKTMIMNNAAKHLKALKKLSDEEKWEYILMLISELELNK